MVRHRDNRDRTIRQIIRLTRRKQSIHGEKSRIQSLNQSDAVTCLVNQPKQCWAGSRLGSQTTSCKDPFEGFWRVRISHALIQLGLQPAAFQIPHLKLAQRLLDKAIEEVKVVSPTLEERDIRHARCAHSSIPPQFRAVSKIAIGSSRPRKRTV